MEIPDPLEPNREGTRWFRRSIASPVAALTVQAEGGFRAATVNAFMVTSLDPPQILVSLERDGQMTEWIESAGSFALCLLTRADQFLADQFAGFAPRASGTFEGIPHTTAVTGSPILLRSTAWADCELERQFETGDHTCLVGTIRALGEGEGDPDDALLYYLNGYRRPGR